MKTKSSYSVITIIIMMSMTMIAYGQQPPDTLWTTTIGGTDYDECYSLVKTYDGGLFLFGATESYGFGGYDMWLIKTDSEGNELWNKTYGGMYSERGYSAKQTSDGGFILLGDKHIPDEGDYDLWLLKTDSEGNDLWKYTFGGNSDDCGYSVKQTSDGGFILLGFTNSFGAVYSDIWLVKTDINGIEIWDRTFGGEGRDIGKSVEETSDGGFVLLGYTGSFGSGGSDIWLIKTDAEGNEMWSKTFGGEFDDFGYSIRETTDDGFILLGNTCSIGAGGSDIWLIKTDSDGNALWNKTFGQSGWDSGYSVEQTSDGGFIILGSTEYYGAGRMDLWLIKTDGEGNEIWNKIIGGPENDVGRSVVETSDGGFVLLGKTESYGAGDEDVWLVKVNYVPSSFNLLTPVDEDTIVAGPVEFDWEDSVDPYSGEVLYDLYLDTDSGFMHPEIVSGLHESSYSYPEDMVNMETYYWRVRATDELGMSTWSNETRCFLTNYEEYWWELSSAKASDNENVEAGIDDDDYVQITFESPTDKPGIDASNIDTIFRLSGGHTWLDGEGGVREVTWDDEGSTVTIYLSTNTLPPTVAPGDTITPGYYRMTGTPCIITGSFESSSVKSNNIPSVIPSELTLYPNRPNPFNPVTTISFGVPKEGRVIVSIFDLQGRLVERLFDGVKPAGTASFVWNANSLASGVYLYRVEMPDNGSIRTGKMMLLK